MAFLGGLGALAGLAEGYAAQQQRQQLQNNERVRAAFAIQQLQEQQRQRQQQQNIAHALAGGFRSGTLTGVPDISPLAAIPQGTGAGGGMPGGGMPSTPPGDGSMPLRQVIRGPEGAIPLIDRLIRGEGGSSPQGVVNNPGNIKYAGLPGQTDSGVRATDGGDFASYATPQAGRAAIGALVENAAAGRSKAYGPAPTLDSFIKTYTGKASSGGGGSAPPAPEGVQAPAMPPPPGGYDIATLAHQIERANPGIDDETLIGAVDAASQLMSRGTQQQWQRYLETRKLTDEERNTQIRQQEMQAGRAQTKELAEERMDIQRSLGQGRLQQGQERLDIAKGTPASQSEIDFWTNVVKQGGTLPPGLSRTASGSKLVQQVMANIAGAGVTPGALIAGQAGTKANQSSLTNMTKMADAATSFERTANRNFDLALKLSKDAVPTDWGPWLNRWIENGETQAGNKDVPPYVAAMLTAANEYAKIMSGSTGSQGSTVDSRREAAELFSPYLSAGQIERVVGIAKADMANRKSSLYGQIDDIKDRLKAGGAAPSAPAAEPTGSAHPDVVQGGHTYTWKNGGYVPAGQ